MSSEVSRTAGKNVDPALYRRWAMTVSGLILFAYVLTHLLNHVAGLWSLGALEQGREVVFALWRNPIGTALLYGGLIIHAVIALWSLYRRDNFRALTVFEWAQLILGLAIPFLLALHVLGTRGAHELFDMKGGYEFVLLVQWVFMPHYIWLQTISTLAAWVHGCLGLHLWLRFKPGYRTWYPWLYTGAILIPTLSLAGFVSSGSQVAELARDPKWQQRVAIEARFPADNPVPALISMEQRFQTSFAGLIGLALVAGWIRRRRAGKGRSITIDYDGLRTVQGRPEMTLLEISRSNGIAHTSICGGRGRCSTCRVRVAAGLDSLDPPSDTELKVLSRIDAPPNIRLACQVRPTGALSITPLVPPQASGSEEVERPSQLQGQERAIAVMFIDIRDFTALAEQRLPYDVVFILNRYFAEMGSAIESAGGRIDKFIGDGVMALFGVTGSVEQGCRQALEAARRVGEGLDALNRSLTNEIPSPLRIGIGLHAGSAIVGEMGYKQVVGITAIGDAVNTASRLEALSKEFGAQLVVSRDIEHSAGVTLDQFPVREVEIRGRREPLAVRVIDNANKLDAVG